MSWWEFRGFWGILQRSQTIFAKVSVDVFGNHGLWGLLEESAHEKSPKCLSGNLGDFGEFCKGLKQGEYH